MGTPSVLFDQFCSAGAFNSSAPFRKAAFQLNANYFPGKMVSEAISR
jgi:hypothetical protein